MKKILLSCLLAVGIGANAQFNITGDFDTNTDVSGLYGQFGGGTITAAAACTGTNGGQLAISTSVTQTGWMIIPSAAGQVTNGQKVTLNISYKKASGPVGTLYACYMVQDPNTGNWSIKTLKSVSLTSAAITSCNTASFANVVIPAGTIVEGSTYGFGVFFVRSSGAGNIYVDDIQVVQDVVTTAPGCTTVTAPANGSTVSYGQTNITWNSAATATSFNVKVGTTSGGSDVFSGTVTGATLSQYVSTNPNTTYYVNVTPHNNNGDATGCAETTFTTNNSLGYCIVGATSTNFEKISNVTFGTINNNSTSTAGYEDFTAQSTDVTPGSSYPISATISNFDSSGDNIMAWIDFNQNGIFEDSEKTTLTAAATATGNIAIPSDAKIGTTRMRVKLAYGSSNLTACGTYSFGQVEDYSVNVVTSLAASTVTKNTVSVYPNPFRDVLKISDVKNVKSISITDGSGRQVKTLAPAAELDLSSLNAGLYIVTLQMNDGTVKTVKAIKK